MCAFLLRNSSVSFVVSLCNLPSFFLLHMARLIMKNCLDFLFKSPLETSFDITIIANRWIHKNSVSPVHTVSEFRYVWYYHFFSDIAESRLQSRIADNVLTELSKHIENCVFHLGIDLEPTVEDVEEAMYKYPRLNIYYTNGKEQVKHWWRYCNMLIRWVFIPTSAV